MRLLQRSLCPVFPARLFRSLLKALVATGMSAAAAAVSSAGTSDAKYDLDRSWVIDAGDLVGVVSSMRRGTLSADFNNDSDTDCEDLFLLCSRWGIKVDFGDTLPTDPEDIAPPGDDTVPSDIYEDTEFIYSGTDPIQIWVEPGTIEATRVAILRGRVLVRDGTGEPGVEITILNQPKYGKTLSREDGMFDMAVNGGGVLTVNYRKEGLLPVQRKIQVPLRDYVWLPDVIMIPLDPQVTTVDLTSSEPFQVAAGSVVTDDDGTRQAVLMIPRGTTAEITLPDGTTQSITTLSLRATEYTVGENGPETMPAELPPTSGYTYAVELSADEALANGIKVNGKDVVFNQPVPFYVDNFLNFPVGTIVPVGYYDNDKGTWIPYDNGLVIGIVDITSSLADVDVDGDGLADTGIALSDLGITDAEREQLAALYSPGGSLWRAQLAHLSTWDCNWPFAPPADATEPPAPREENKPDGSCEDEGSIIGCQSQTLGESVSVTGTKFTLNYKSDRVPGHLDSYTMDVPISGATVPASLIGIELKVTVAGQELKQSFPPNPNQSYTFTWDGMDAYGRTLQGPQPVRVSVGFTYQGSYQETDRFGYNGNGTVITGSKTREEVTLWQEWTDSIGTWDARGQGLGGWTFDVHHAYDFTGKTLYLGDGSRRSAWGIFAIDTVAGGGGFCSPTDACGDGGPATSAHLSYPYGVATGPDGSIYIADRNNNRIRRVGPDGIITTVVGTGNNGYSGDGGPATDAQLDAPEGVAIGPNGSIYIADLNNHCIRRVGPDGMITTVAGIGTNGYSGDGGPATAAQLYSPAGVAVGADGTIYIADTINRRIRRVGPDGIITTMAGTTGPGGYSGDGGPATDAQLNYPQGLAIGPDGSIYIADTQNDRIRQVKPDGIITTVAGTGTGGYSGDGGPATEAQIEDPESVAIGPDGSIYVADRSNHCIRHVGPEGIITTVAGVGTSGYSGDGGPPTEAQLNYPRAVAIGPDGSLYIADRNNNRIRSIGTPFPGFTAADIVIPSEDGSRLYHFNANGRHLQTLSALTGALLYSFSYDTDGLLADIVDSDGNTTTINRDGSGNPTSIVAPRSQTTNLVVNGDGYLESISNPAGEVVALTYVDNGLLDTFTDPKSNSSQYTYDPMGLLTLAEDRAGGSKSLSRTKDGTGYTVTKTTAMGRVATYQTEYLSTGDTRWHMEFPDGTRNENLQGADGSRTISFFDGTVVTTKHGPDPRFGMLAPVGTSTELMPSGLTKVVETTRDVVLADPSDPLSLTSLTETRIVNGRAFVQVFDAATATRTTTTPEGRQTIEVLDAAGRVVSTETVGLAPILFTYDGQGRLETITRGGRLWRYGYDGACCLASSIHDPLDQQTLLLTDAVGRVTKVIRNDASELLLSYDPNGNLVSLTPPGRSTHTFDFTPVDLQSAYTPPDIGIGPTATLSVYNLDRQLELVTRPDAKQLDYSYDFAGRLSTTTVPSGTRTQTYDPTTGMLASVTSPDAVALAFGYDGSLLSSLSWSGPLGGSVEFVYDDDFRITQETVNGATPILFGYDLDDLMTQAGALSLTRDPQTGLVTNTSLGTTDETYTYNVFGELTDFEASAISSVVYDVTYVRDDLGRITDKSETVQGVTTDYGYSYDPAGRLSEVYEDGALVREYGYDNNGNRLTVTDSSGTTFATYDGQDRLTSYGSNSYSYTANGELLQKVGPTATTDYVYDVLGGLESVTLPSGDVVEYRTDGRTSRVLKLINGAVECGWLYRDPLQPIAELDAAGAVTARFVYTTRPNVPDYMVKGGNTYRLFQDHLGSVRLVIDVASGSVAQRIDYDEFGRVITDTNPSFQPFGFAGGLYDADTGLVRFGARDYDAEVGRWTSKDPIFFDGDGPNLYEYVLGDPVNRRDPNGTRCDLGQCFRECDDTILNKINLFLFGFAYGIAERFHCANLCRVAVWQCRSGCRHDQ